MCCSGEISQPEVPSAVEVVMSLGRKFTAVMSDEASAPPVVTDFLEEINGLATKLSLQVRLFTVSSGQILRQAVKTWIVLQYSIGVMRTSSTLCNIS